MNNVQIFPMDNSRRPKGRPSLRMESSDEYVLPGRTVVVCEDEGLTQMQIQRALQRAGLHVVGSAVSGKEALHTILEHRPDIVIMDIGIPGPDGLEVAEHILAVCAPCVVVLTAFTDEEHRRRAERAGACAYLVKPITGEMLLKALQDAWDRYLSSPEETCMTMPDRKPKLRIE